MKIAIFLLTVFAGSGGWWRVDTERFKFFHEDYILANGRYCGEVERLGTSGPYDAEVNYKLISQWSTKHGAEKAVQLVCDKQTN